MYDLEERTINLAIDVRNFTQNLPRTTSNIEDVKQVVRSSGSIGANYIEANEALSKKDFIMRLKISRKESKETIYWLKIILATNNLEQDLRGKGEYLIKETGELRNILSAIFKKTE